MPSTDPTARRLVATVAAHSRWAACSDRSAATAPARRAFVERFEKQVDPDGVLAPDERARRAEHASKAHFLRLALKSTQARRKVVELTTAAEAAEAELDSAAGDAA